MMSPLQLAPPLPPLSPPLAPLPRPALLPPAALTAQAVFSSRLFAPAAAPAPTTSPAPPAPFESAPPEAASLPGPSEGPSEAAAAASSPGPEKPSTPAEESQPEPITALIRRLAAASRSKTPALSQRTSLGDDSSWSLSAPNAPPAAGWALPGEVEVEEEGPEAPACGAPPPMIFAMAALRALALHAEPQVP